MASQRLIKTGEFGLTKIKKKKTSDCAKEKYDFFSIVTPSLYLFVMFHISR